MYSTNKLKRPVLITPDEVLFHAPTDQKIDERQILSNIIVAEERWIATAIGDDMYEDFITKKNRLVTNENQQLILDEINDFLEANKLPLISMIDLPIGAMVNAIEFVKDEWLVKLWDRFLWKLTAECVDVAATVPSWVRHTSAGQMKNNPNVLGGNGTNSASAELKEVQLKVTRAIQDRIDPLTERMKFWLCKNRARFGNYNLNCAGYGCGGYGENYDGISHIRKTNFITNLYDDDRIEKPLFRLL